MVLPTYNGARRRPNLMPLLAMMLAREGIPVLIHGRFDFDTRADPFALLRVLGLPMAESPAEAGELLASRRIACIGTDRLLPGLDALLSLRPQLGVRNSGHSMSKMIDPMPGRSVRVVPVTHPEYMEKMTRFLLLDGGRSLLMRGTEGEAYANPARCPQMTEFVDGVTRILAEAGDGAAALSQPEAGIEAAENADLILRSLDSGQELPAPLRLQFDACVTLARE